MWNLLVEYARIVWKHAMFMICKALEKEVSLLSEFNKLWGSGQLICHRIGRRIMRCLHQPLARVVL